MPKFYHPTVWSDLVLQNFPRSVLPKASMSCLTLRRCGARYGSEVNGGYVGWIANLGFIWCRFFGGQGLAGAASGNSKESR